MAERAASRNRCGSCTLCCRLVGVLELAKPPDEWCRHCLPGLGCRIYEDRPKSCQAFECFWFSNDWMPDALRPDRCNVIFEGMQEANTILAIVHPDHPDAWQAPAVLGFMEMLVRRHGIAFLISEHLVPDGELKILLPPGRTEEDVLAGCEIAARANIGRYAAQEGIDADAAWRQVLGRT
jgi:hypothetical protein